MGVIMRLCDYRTMLLVNGYWLMVSQGDNVIVRLWDYVIGYPLSLIPYPLPLFPIPSATAEPRRTLFPN
jgi:hypothetical protein